MRKVDLELLDFELKQKNSSVEDKIKEGKIWRIEFPGMILDVQNVYLTCLKNLELNVFPIHPYRSDLTFRKDKTLDRIIFPLTINAVLITKKGEIVLGVRGGEVDAGKVGTLPGGHIDYQIPLIEDVNTELFREFEEELGVAYDPKKHKLSLIGVMGNDDLPGINILNSVEVDNTFEDIVDSWKNAKDRFEHDSLFRANLKEVYELAKKGRTRINGKNYETTPIFQDCLNHFIKFYEETNKKFPK